MKLNLKPIYIFSILIYFLQAWEGLGSQAFSLYLKNLGWSPSKMMYVGSIVGISWVLKPFIGMLVDKYLTNKKWIKISVITSIILASIIMLIKLPIWLLITSLTIMSTSTALRDISVDGMMCKNGKENNTTGLIQSVQWISITFASLLIGVVGGFIAEKFTYQSAYYLIIPVYLLLLYFCFKNKSKESSKESIKLSDYKKVFCNKKFLLACLFLFLFKYSPSFGTPLYFKELDVFKWSPFFIGCLGSIASLFSIIGAFIYAKISKKIDFKKWMFWSVLLGAITSFCYLYFVPWSDILYTCLFSFIGMAVMLMSLDWMAQNTVTGLEATSFVILCAISNLAGSASSLSGAWLLPRIGLNWCIVISGITSLFCLPLIPLIFKEKRQ